MSEKAETKEPHAASRPILTLWLHGSDGVPPRGHMAIVFDLHSEWMLGCGHDRSPRIQIFARSHFARSHDEQEMVVSEVNPRSPSVARRSLLAGGLGAALVTASTPSRAAMDSEASSDPRAYLSLIDAVAQAGIGEGQPDALLAELDRALAQSVGHKLFTVLVLNEEVGRNQRYYSNQPQAYPVGGSKPVDRSSALYKDVIVGGKPRICYDYDDIKRAFFDHELIRSLGCESAVNFPVRWNGKTIGTLNLLHQAGWYNDRNVASIGSFAALSRPALIEIGRNLK